MPDSEVTTAGPLAGIRVLDLATERAELAGRMLADLGADVLKIEPPGGVRSRHLAPFDERPDAPREPADLELKRIRNGQFLESIVLVSDRAIETNE